MVSAPTDRISSRSNERKEPNVKGGKKAMKGGKAAKGGKDAACKGGKDNCKGGKCKGGK